MKEIKKIQINKFHVFRVSDRVKYALFDAHVRIGDKVVTSVS